MSNSSGRRLVITAVLAGSSQSEVTYTIRFSPDPPVGAFWSITLYDIPNYYMVANAIDRYPIDDRTPGIRRSEDNALTITVTATEPQDRTARANWLPRS
jgi:hypothetical protein